MIDSFIFTVIVRDITPICRIITFNLTSTERWNLNDIFAFDDWKWNDLYLDSRVGMCRKIVVGIENFFKLPLYLVSM